MLVSGIEKRTNCGAPRHRSADPSTTPNTFFWQVAVTEFHPELAVGRLRAIDVPLDLYDQWNRMVDELDDMDIDRGRRPDRDENTQALALLRPDAWGIAFSKQHWQVLLLELTRANDWRQDWASTTDTYKVQ